MQTDMNAMKNRTATAPADASADTSTDPTTGADTGADTSADDSAGQSAAPQDQALYDKVMTGAMAQLYGDDTTHQAIVKKLNDEKGNLAHGVGHTAAMILKSIMGAAEQQGVTIPDDVALHAGTEIVAELVSICESMGLVKDGPESEKLYQDSCLEATRVFGETLAGEGRITPEVQQQARDTMQQQMTQEKGGGQGGAPPQKGIVDGAIDQPSQDGAQA